METSAVRQRIHQAIDRARREAGHRRTRADEAARSYEVFLRDIAIPLFRQIADTLKAGKYPFTLFTPTGSVRLSSDKTAEDYIELTLDTAGDRPVVIGHISRARGRRVIESERPIADGQIGEITAEQVLEFVALELEPFVER